jgi:hypothetical protein
MAKNLPDLKGYILNEIESNGTNFIYFRLAKSVEGYLHEVFLCTAYHRVEACDFACDPMFPLRLSIKLERIVEDGRYILEFSNEENRLAVSFKGWSVVETRLAI